MMKRGKYVLFDIDPVEIKLQVVTNDGVKTAIIDDTKQVDALLSSIHQAANGWFVGIYEDAHGEFINNRLIYIPACIVPQRSKMVDGGHDMYWSEPTDPKQIYRLTIPLSQLTKLELLTNRNDIPSDKILAANYDPARV